MPHMFSNFSLFQAEAFTFPADNFRVIPQPIPNMTLRVLRGRAMIGNSIVDAEVQNTGTFTPPISGARLDMVVLNANGTISILPGTVGTPPTPPSIPSKGSLPLALVLIDSSTTSLTNENVLDIRWWWRSGLPSIDHNADVSGRSSPDAHPESAITGLVADLAARPTLAAVNTLLAAKADQDGTDSDTFILNKDVTGTPVQNGLFGIRRGVLLNVYIRWNEALDQWELTNDGVNFFAIATLGGSFSAIMTINGISEDSGGNFTIAPDPLTDLKVKPAVNGITIEPPDWHHFTLSPFAIPATTTVVYGTFVIPAGKKVNKVLLGVRRTDDVADAAVFAACKNETTTEELSSSGQYPTPVTFGTTGTAGQRLLVAAKNTGGTPKNIFAEVAILLENV